MVGHMKAISAVRATTRTATAAAMLFAVELVGVAVESLLP
jgi:hypothetical protein